MDRLPSLRGVHDIMQEGSLLKDLPTGTFAEVLQAMVDTLVARELLPAEHRDRCLEGLLAREADVSTAIGHAVATPHARVEGLPKPVVAFARLQEPLDLRAPDHLPTRFVFLILSPEEHGEVHFELLIHITKLMADARVRQEAAEAATHDELVNAFRDHYEREAAAPPPELAAGEGLEFTGRFAGGLLQDLRRRLPHYRTDFTDGLTIKSLASILFLYFACLSAAVAFGGLMGYSTGGAIGVTEMIAATALCGLVYALTAGQPLTLLGGTGPLLVFTTMLYGMCKSYDVPFLPTYGWVGIWAGLFTVLISLLDVSALIRFCTRFTDEIFAALISAIFIVEAISSLAGEFTGHVVSHDTALLSVILAIGTYWIATSLKKVRQGPYLRPWIRELLADFGTIFAIAAMTAVARWLHVVDLEALSAPDHFGTTSGRGWMVDLLSVGWKTRLFAIAPALLVTVLIFLDQNITARLVNKPDNRLKKGSGYHLDMLVVGGLVMVCSVFGLPWLVAATVRSLNHVHSLADVETYVDADQKPRERISGVVENRLTGLGIHILIGASLLVLPLLKLVPVPVLFGLFLYMGVASMTGNQFIDRLKLWIMEPAFYPATHYTKRVKIRRIHAFTFVQLLGLVGLWAVKTSAWKLLFPVAIAALIPVRFVLGRCFTQTEIAALDSEEAVEEEVFQEVA